MKYLKLSVVFALAAIAAGALEAREIKVAPGSLTPHAALLKIREAKKSGDASQWTVRVKPGVYEFDEPLVFTPEDSGSPGAPVKWVGEGKVVFSGGRVLKSWRDDGDGVWSAPIPRGKDGKLAFFESLYVNGRRADRARLPLEGKFTVKSWKEQTLVEGSVTNYLEETVLNGNACDALAGLSKSELAAAQWRVFVKWAYGSYPIESYDAATKAVAVKGRVSVARGGWGKWDADRHNYFYIENVKAGFTRKGQWFYDVTEGRVKYRALSGEKISSIEAIAPTSGLVSLVKFSGDVEKGDFVHDIHFENISFTATRTGGDSLENGVVRQYQHQAARATLASVMGEGAHRVRFERCRVFNTENYAFRFEDGCVSNAIVSCEIVDAGAGGIWLGNDKSNILKYANPETRDIKDPPWNRPLKTEPLVDTSFRAVRFNVIDNNLITRCGRVNPEGVGVVLTHAADTKVTHNEISDLYYTGISVGWTWGYWGSYAQRNEISFNRITDIGKGEMADMGGVYTLGASYGTVITNNVIMDINSISYGGWGMYNDEGSEGVLWQNNLVVNTSTDSYHQHFGRSNSVVNCIMANARGGKICISRTEDHHQVTFERNIVYWPSGPLYVGWNAFKNNTAKVRMNNNLFWCSSGLTELNGNTIGFVGDPLFVDPKNGNWRLKENSPALKLGFKPWDYTLSGRRRE